MVYKIAKYVLLLALLLSLGFSSYYVFESLNIKKGVTYENLDEIPNVSWLNIRSGIFGLVLRTTYKSTLVSYDETKYMSVIAPNEDRYKEYSEASLYYLANGIKDINDTNAMLFNYPAVFKTKYKKNDYLIFLQAHIQKNEKTGYIITAYPLNLIRTKTVGQFIDMITNQTFPAPTPSAIYKFDSFETCNQKFNDKNYCKWIFSNQNTIYKIVKKWGETDVVPLSMMKYPLILNKNRI